MALEALVVVVVVDVFIPLLPSTIGISPIDI
jgi:hypothetical protein